MAETSEPDGLPLDQAQPYAEIKHGRHRYYCNMFSVAMRPHWKSLCYVGLCTGSGRAQIRGTSEVVETSPIQALRSEVPFDTYIFCDRDPEALRALKARTDAVLSETGRDPEVVFVPGDVNESIGVVDESMPHFKGLLTFCFLDPYATDVRFDTLRSLLWRKVDLLTVLMLGQDVQRNRDRYLDKANTRVEEWIGDPSWREAWAQSGQDLVPFLGFHFGRRLTEEFKYVGIENRDIAEIHNSRGVPLYWLTFYSKSELGMKFWRETRGADPQGSLNL